MAWRLDEWNAHYSKNDSKLLAMSKEEIREAIQYLRSNSYPKPEDCLGKSCSNYRPACRIGTCKIAAVMCGDY